MSLNPLLIACEDLGAKLDQVWASADPLSAVDPIPFLEFILSPENTSGIVQAVAPGRGKVRSVNVQWEQRIAESEVTSVTGRDCEATGTNKMFEANYTIDTQDVEKISQVIKVEDLAHLCEDNPNYVARQIAKMADAMDRKVASNIASEAAALVGRYSASAATYFGNSAMPSPYDTLVVATKDASGNIVPGAWEKIDMARIMSGFSSFVGFGSAALAEYMRLGLAGCCTNYGLDIAEIYNLYGKSFAYDRRLAAALATDSDALFMEIGALQLLTYTQNPGLGVLNFDLPFEAFNMVTPRGLPVDVLIKVDCPGEIHINMFSNTKLIGQPDDLYAVGDDFRGTKGTGFVKITNPS